MTVAIDVGSDVAHKGAPTVANASAVAPDLMRSLHPLLSPHTPRSIADLPKFELPPELEASVPPEARGITRDAVRMLVASRSSCGLVHSHFSEIPRFFDDGDLIIVNTSGTLAAAVAGTLRPGSGSAPGCDVEVHLSTRLPAGLWTIELRHSESGDRRGRVKDRAGTGPVLDACAGDVVELPGGAHVSLLTPYSQSDDGVRLWVATFTTAEPDDHLESYLAIYGKPIKYGYVAGSWPITMYQNVYATEPGSAEMPSAGRPFTPEVITRLVARGVGVAPILLHTGVASLEANEPPYPEQYRVSRTTAHRVNDTRRNGGKVIAIGTTVVRALETVVDDRGLVHAGSGWTDTVITPEKPVLSVDGLLTGWHEPEASHLAMLLAISGSEVVERSYAAALEYGYLWHEFGDVHLLLP
jgi:S-adenosylmethionine:tRNA ribosyltransferase-isomerase